jgi:hypothetical protein
VSQPEFILVLTFFSLITVRFYCSDAITMNGRGDVDQGMTPRLSTARKRFELTILFTEKGELNYKFLYRYSWTN